MRDRLRLKNFLSLVCVMVHRGLSTLPKNEKVKVESIREVVVVTHDGVKRKLVDVRYVLKHERNLI